MPMDPPRRDGPSFLLAPAARGGATVLSFPPPERERSPGGRAPGLDEHLVKPETTRNEVIRGRSVVAQPALEPHADAHAKIEAVVHWHVRDGYQTSIDLLTRSAQDSDFATDISIRRDGIDSATGQRYLEEISFEIASEQTLPLVREKAIVLAARGVRRIFTIFVKENRVCEWAREQHNFVALERDSVIEDPCFVRPISVRAFIEKAVAEREAVRALAARGGDEVQALRNAARREMLLALLRARFGEVPEDVLARIRAATAEQLMRWAERVLTATTLSATLETA